MCTIPLVAMGIGTGLSVMGKISQGRQAAALAEAQAQAYEQQAEADRRSSNFEIAQNVRQFQARQGEAIAQVGASGVGLAGSPTEVLAANAGDNQIDIEAIRYGSLLRQGQLKSQAGISRFEGRAARQAGFLGAATDAIGGFGPMFDPTKSIRFGGPNAAFAPRVNGLPNYGGPR